MSAVPMLFLQISTCIYIIQLLMSCFIEEIILKKTIVQLGVLVAAIMPWNKRVIKHVKF